MKNYPFLLAATALTVIGLGTSCNSNNSVPEGYWRIEGTIVSPNEADSLYIIDFNSTDNDTIATLHTRNGEIVPCQGTVRPDGFCRLSIAGYRRNLSYGFFPEHGTIRLELDICQERPKVLTVGGTPANDDFYRLMLASRGFDERNDTMEQWREHANGVKTIAQELIEKYGEHPLTLFILQHLNYYFTADELKAILEKRSPQFRANRFISLAEEQAGYMKGAEEGDKIKDFRGTTLQGDSVNLYDYVGKGKYVLLDFAGNACTGCVMILPDLQKLYEKYQDKGLVVLGAHSGTRDLNQLKALLQEKGITFPTILGCKYMSLYGIFSIPTLMLIDPEGKILFPRSAPEYTILGEVERIMEAQGKQ